MSTIHNPDIYATFAIEHLEAGDKEYLLVVLHSIAEGQDYAEIAVKSSSKGNMSLMLEALHDKCTEALTKKAKKEG